jgi:glyoxylase-like metal-dependent hydrolase (beta-lactamase superfamily II)
MEDFCTRVGLVPLETPTPFIVGPVNVFLLKGGPLTLIDTGTCTPEAEATLKDLLAQHGVQFSDIQRIFLTHHHVDHTGLTRRIVAASGAEVWAHPHLARQAALGHSHDEAAHRFFLDILHEFGVPADVSEQSMVLWDAFKSFAEDFKVDHVFSDGGAAGPFRTYFVPGHSATDTLLIHESDGYSIGGDHILESINPNPLLRRPEPGQPRPPALVQYQQSLNRSRTLPLGRCFPGHGAPMEDPNAVIDGILSQHARRNARVLAAVTPEGVCPYTLCRSFFPTLPLEHLYLGLSVAIGHMELLEAAGQLKHEHRDGIIHYQPA